MEKRDRIDIYNRLSPHVRLNTICPYFTMFPLSFPYKILNNAKKTEVVYDPFCGRGTTNYAARLLGIESYGVDSNPVAYAIAQAKLVDVTCDEIVIRCTSILQNTPANPIPQEEFWLWAYHPVTLDNICKLRNYFLSASELDKIDIALRAIILGVLHGPLMKSQPSYLSNQMPRTFATKPDYSVAYWKKHEMLPQEVNLLELVERKSKYIFSNQLPSKRQGKIILGDSRTLKNVTDKKFNWIITSPPYYGMSTYEQDQWLRNWFLGGQSKVNYSSKSQLKHWSEKAFIGDLAEVWSNTAKMSNPNARLVIRFGALPSKSEKTPKQLIKESFELSDCGWKINAMRSAGEPKPSNRQAIQFKGTTGNYIEEIDVYAILNI